MALQSLSDLKTAVTSWLDRADLADRVGDFIALAEADFRRQLVMPDMETMAVISATSPYALPADLDSIRAVALAGDDRSTVDPIGLAQMLGLPDETAAYPRFYAVDGSTLLLWPFSALPISLTLAYRAQLPALTDSAPTNWLLAGHPDAYLFGTLVQAEFYGWNDERLPLIQAKLQATIDDINRAGNRKRYGGQIAMRSTAEHTGIRTGAYRW